MEMQMKLLWIIKNFPPNMGGVQQYTFHYVLNFPPGSCVVLTRKREHENENKVYEIDNLLRQNQQAIFRSLDIPDDLRLSSVYKHPILFLSFCLQVIRVIKKELISHVIFANPTFFYFISLSFLKLIFRLPFICVFHGEDIPTIKRRSNGLFRWVINRLDVHICNSCFTHDRLQNFLGRKIQRYIAYPGVDEKFFKSIGKEDCKKQFGVSGRHVLYTVGRLDERKGHEMVIKSMPLIIEQIPDVVYLIGGQGPYLQKLKDLVDELNLSNYVNFCGFIEPESIVAFHNAGDVFVMPNRILPDGDSEGFGIVFIEAAAAGNPVIGGKAGGAIEAVVDGVTGYLVDPHNKNDFVEKTVFLLKSKLTAYAMGNEGQKRAMNSFRWSDLALCFSSKLNGWVR